MPQIASNGTGYAVAWAYVDGIYAAINDAGSWQPDELLEGLAGDVHPPRIAASASGYVVTWRQDLSGNTGSALANRATFSGAWSWGTATLLENTPANVEDIVHVASDGVGYMALWTQGDQAFANSHDGTDWTGAQLLGSGSCAPYQAIGANTSSYLATYSCGFQLRAREWVGGSWGSEEVVRSGSSYKSIVASDGSDYMLSFTATGDLRYASYQAGVWGQPDFVEHDPGTVSPTDPLGLVFDGVSYTVFWGQPDPADITVHRILSRRGL